MAEDDKKVATSTCEECDAVMPEMVRKRCQICCTRINMYPDRCEDCNEYLYVCNQCKCIPITTIRRSELDYSIRVELTLVDQSEYYREDPRIDPIVLVLPGHHSVDDFCVGDSNFDRLYSPQNCDLKITKIHSFMI